MRLLIVGTLDGHITTAGRLALESGAKVAHVDDIDSALTALRSGQGADMVMVEVNLDIATLCKCLRSERISVPVIACGIGPEPAAAANAIRAGAQEYVPLPPDAELIAAVLAAVSEETSTLVFRDPAMNPVLRLAEQVAPSTPAS
jgi:two-component system, response regulator FlrC